MAKRKQEEMVEEQDAAEEDIFDPDKEQRQRDAKLAESATLAALKEVQRKGCLMPEKLMTRETVGSVPPGTTGYIDPYYLGVDETGRCYLYGRAPLIREPRGLNPRPMLRVMRTHEGWTAYALAFAHYTWSPCDVMWPFATEKDIVPVFQLQA